VRPVSTATPIPPAAEAEKAPRASLDAFGAPPSNDGAEFLASVRSAARERFAERGLPTTRDEDWRFTSIAPLARTTFVRPDPAISTRVSAADIAPWRLAGSLAEIVFVDGVFAPALSRLPTTPGLVVGGLREKLTRDGQAIQPHLTWLLGDRANAFADLNSALFEDGAVVEVRPGAIVQEPLHLLFVSSAQRVSTAAYPRVLVLAGAGSEATIVETYAGPAGPPSLVCPVTEIQVGENAALRRYKIQDEAESTFHVSSLAAQVARHGRFHDYSISLGALLSRHDLHVLFAGEGGEATLDGLFFADGDRHTDTRSVIDHAEPHCTSREVYKGIVDGRGRGVFNGRIRVREGAQKTDAAQSNKNLLLSRGALVHSIPQLEILADDVKCRHGATTGQLDETALFYLRSRGLSLDVARGLLTVAFAADLVNRIAVPALRERVAKRLLSRLPGATEVREAAL
jgi:Fe-S cluster assembly protein SufD